MKLKQKPEDFRVEEIAQPNLGDGRFALYRLAKKSLGTPEAIGAICRAWRLKREAVAVGGLKDRHAATRQYLSIENGPRRKLTQTNFSLDYLGQSSRPFDSSDISANRFEIVIRDLGQLEVEKIADNPASRRRRRCAQLFRRPALRFRRRVRRFCGKALVLRRL